MHPISLHGMKMSCVCGRRVSWISCLSVIARNDMYWRSSMRCGAVGGIVGFIHTNVDLTDGKVRRNFLLLRPFLPPLLDPATVHLPSDGSARRFLYLRFFEPSHARLDVCLPRHRGCCSYLDKSSFRAMWTVSGRSHPLDGIVPSRHTSSYARNHPTSPLDLLA